MSTTRPPASGDSTSTRAPSPGPSTSTQPPLDVVLRSHRETDLPHVYRSWLKSYRKGSLWASQTRRLVFDHRHHDVIEGILGRPGVSVLIATPRDDDETILGWSVREDLNFKGRMVSPVIVLHYVHVKEPLRGFGLARMLCAGLPETFSYSHRTLIVSSALERRPGTAFDPYLMLATLPEVRGLAMQQAADIERTPSRK